MKKRLLAGCYEAEGREGEDSFALRSGEHSAFLCVADGCGGLGSRRYESLQGHTGAYEASKLAVQVMDEEAQGWPLPDDKEQGEEFRRKTEQVLEQAFRHYADAHGMREKGRITGSMQRCLPCTLCAVWLDDTSACIAWAGDSRAYVLDAQGLHQCTADHLKGSPDALNSLYRDVPLSGLISADGPVHLSMCRVRLPQPCAMLMVTDGVYSALSSPMAFETLLLDALHQAQTGEMWRDRLMESISVLAQDDATIALWIPEDFAAFRAMMEQRREDMTLTEEQSLEERWIAYRAHYDWTEGSADGRMDWRI